MCRFSRLALAASVLTTAAYAQAPAHLPQAPAPQANARRADSSSTEQVEIVDVAVQGRDGHPVHGLRLANFHLSENNIPQTILRVAEHNSLASVEPVAELPRMPSGTFTNYMPLAADGTLNILVLDALNTPAKNQNFMRNELEAYAKEANPHTRIAIFGFANRLILLQGFTSNPATLRSVLEHKLIPRTPLLGGADGNAASQKNVNGEPEDDAPSESLLAANLEEFQAETGAMETQLRMQFTLDAFNTLGHYLAALPGRKNVIWFSGTFPLNLSEAPSEQSPPGNVQVDQAQVDQDEFRETVNLLNRARVAIYPMEAHGPMPDSKHDAYGWSTEPADRSGKHKLTQSDEHITMDALAKGSGGRAFYNVDNLADAVAEAVAADADYYTMIYSPNNQKQDGTYREQRVDLAGVADASGLQLIYRHGYLAQSAEPSAVDGASAKAAEKAYGRAAMSRGAPTPEDLLFKVRVLPASDAEESSAAPGNMLDPSVSPKGPFRRFNVDFVAFPKELTLTLEPDARRSGEVEFLTYVFDVDGRLLNATGKTYKLNLTPATYARLITGAIECHLNLSVPAGTETFLRIGIRDVPTNHFGVVAIPTAIVSHLAPLAPLAPSIPPAPAMPKPAGAPPS